MERLKDELDEGDAWTPEVCTGEDPTPLGFYLFGSLETLLADHVEPGIDLLRLAAAITQDEVLADWARARGRTVAASLVDELADVARKLAEGAPGRAELRETLSGIARRAATLQVYLPEEEEDEDDDEGDGKRDDDEEGTPT